MIKEKIKTINRCDLVSLAGTALYALFGMANLLFYAVLQEPVPFITMCAVFIVGILISLFIYKNRLPMLWLFLGIGGFVAHFCSNMFGYVSNVVFLFQGLVSAVCFLLGVLLQFKKKWYPRRFAAVTFSVMLVFMALFGGFWGGNIVYARKKTAVRKTRSGQFLKSTIKQRVPNKAGWKRLHTIPRRMPPTGAA